MGVEWILDFDNDDRGIGSGSDQLAPLIGVALSPRPGTTLIPLIQQFWSYSGNDVNTTGPPLNCDPDAAKGLLAQVRRQVPHRLGERQRFSCLTRSPIREASIEDHGVIRRWFIRTWRRSAL